MCAGVKCSEVSRIGVLTVARIHLELSEVFSKLNDSLLVAVRLLVGVGIQSKEKGVVGQMCLHVSMHSSHNRHSS